jgi:ankyrin repeat protein
MHVMHCSDRDGYTALMWAAFKGRSDTASALLQAGLSLIFYKPGRASPLFFWLKPRCAHYRARTHDVDSEYI